ncbi:hypothetical protein HYH96_02590 [Clostridium botulinum]|uniref:Uncharacterized protein n=1 Tax=Clostridium botulinum TaxID=1491 RepID=A0A6G4EDA0_CLOBO|nr:hypothetical protein [Clostridium botulinum]AUM91497.1 hypothetical protein RSJ5_09500 [Clostridium botulinum]MBD5642783.1 hypothetical protein [Clostridium botulinum]NFB12895.1 hypothetical protein [Clostridium botulinum]NFH57825.1 hypothetical protein [Clostridium botulinum]NFH61212.1 hypothetical protein [Clostridium botulinum]
MFYYDVEKNVSSIYNTQELQIVGYVDVFLGEKKENKLTTISFNELGIYLLFKDCPKDREEFDNFIENKALEEINKEEIQEKLKEIKLAYNMGLLE